MGEIQVADKEGTVAVDCEQQKAENGLAKRVRDGCCWYESPLPKPPVPDLDHTLDRYLEYARVLAKSQGLDLNRTAKCVREFRRTIGERLQQRLTELAAKEDNWVNRFWLPEMYLRQRLPLPLNFNPAYIFPRRHFASVRDQLDYASWLVRGLLDFKHRVMRVQIPRERVPERFCQGGQQMAFMCMDQYERILSCYREPNVGEDILHDRRTWPSGGSSGKAENSQPAETEQEHILVMSHRQAFVLFTRRKDGGEPLTAPEIAEQLHKIHGRAQNRNGQTVIPVGGASSGERDRAGRFWAEMSKEPANRRSLAWVRSSVFALCLDEWPPAAAECGADHGSRAGGVALPEDGHRMLHGLGPARNGLNRWYDATIQLIVSRDGCCGLCIEHSVAEGIVIINMTEQTIRFADQNFGSHQNDAARETMGQTAHEPMLLSWALDESTLALLWEQIADFDRLAKDIQLEVLEFNQFGKTSIKGWHVSPDGFVQLCMQLAHFKLHGHLVSTYESATMRRFGLGRVDNIRAATPEALEWVLAMESANGTLEEKKQLFLAAAQKQATITAENLTGHGIDNHLCALEVLSRAEDKVVQMFSEPMWKELMRFPLSTSQVSTSLDLRGCYLCYGPVVPDGYGCTYNIQPGKIIFGISAWKSNSKTDIDKFKQKLSDSLADMCKMLE